MLDNPIQKTPKETVRSAAARAIGRLGAIRAGEALVAKLDDPSPNVRFTVAYALGQIRYPEAETSLVKTLDDESELVRYAAIRSLGLIEARHASPVLRRALDANDPWTRFYAAQALVRLGDPTLRGRIPELVRREPIFALRRRLHWHGVNRAARQIQDERSDQA